MTEKERESVLEKRIEFWQRATGYNRMCFKCPLLGVQCRGSRNTRWVDCVKRNCYERKMPPPQIEDGESGKGI